LLEKTGSDRRTVKVTRLTVSDISMSGHRSTILLYLFDFPEHRGEP
jgi:hypothetical protein